jgi:hypothetical protein
MHEEVEVVWEKSESVYWGPGLSQYVSRKRQKAIPVTIIAENLPAFDAPREYVVQKS